MFWVSCLLYLLPTDLLPPICCPSVFLLFSILPFLRFPSVFRLLSSFYFPFIHSSCLPFFFRLSSCCPTSASLLSFFRLSSFYFPYSFLFSSACLLSVLLLFLFWLPNVFHSVFTLPSLCLPSIFMISSFRLPSVVCLLSSFALLSFICPLNVLLNCLLLFGRLNQAFFQEYERWFCKKHVNCFPDIIATRSVTPLKYSKYHTQNILQVCLL